MSNFTPLQRKVKNASASTKTWRGKVLDPGEYYTLDGVAEAILWARDSEVNAAITAGDLITNDGTSDYTNPIAVKNLLRVVRRVNVPLIAQNTLVQLTSYQTVGKFVWVKDRNTTYRSGTVIFDINVPNLAATVRIIDVTNNVVLGTSPSLTSSGIYTLDFINPTTDARLEIQVKLTGLLGILTPPSLNCLSLEWDT